MEEGEEAAEAGDWEWEYYDEDGDEDDYEEYEDGEDEEDAPKQHKQPSDEDARYVGVKADERRCTRMPGKYRRDS